MAPRSADRASVPEYDALIRELHNQRFKEFETEVVRKAALKERAQKNEKARIPRRADFLKSLGLDPRLVEAAEKGNSDLERKELDAFLEEFRFPMVNRKSMRAMDEKWAEARTKVLGETQHLLLHPYAADIYSASADTLEVSDGEYATGALNSGWVFPDDPSHIKIKDGGHVGTWCYEAYASPPDPEFSVHFTFVPATTANYEMTAVLAFHGFYVLRSDDGYFSCRSAHAKLKVSMNVHQYVDHGWRNFPALIDRDEDNVDEVVSYDHTGFFDYTAGLRAGDPVVVTVRGKLDALGVGGYTYAELNFEDGTANYIWPLFLGVIQV